MLKQGKTSFIADVYMAQISAEGIQPVSKPAWNDVSFGFCSFDKIIVTSFTIFFLSDDKGDQWKEGVIKYQFYRPFLTQK